MNPPRKNFKRVVAHLQPAINAMVAELLAGEVPENFPEPPDPGNPVHAVVVENKQGMCYRHHNSMSVPLWAYERGEDYFMYYTAHELSHLISSASLHQREFYKVFKRLCPKRLWRFEITAFPRAWKKFGQSA